MSVANPIPALVPLTPDAVRQLPPRERLPYVEQIRVVYPRWQGVLEAIARCHSRQAYAAEPPCLLFVGPTGAGKTTLIESYAARHPLELRPSGRRVPVLRARIPTPAGINTLTTVLLRALGDPRAPRGTIGEKGDRLLHYLADCGVELLILDELQHFVDLESQRILYTVSNWLKDLIKESRVACVLVGLEGQAEQVVDTNPQLGRLFGDPRVLAPFVWDWTVGREATSAEFRTFLYHLEAQLPLRGAPWLHERDVAWRCWVATGGVVGYVMALVREATWIALTRNGEALTLDLLAEAFTERLAAERRGITNPFIGDPPPLDWRPPPIRAFGPVTRLPARRARS